MNATVYTVQGVVCESCMAAVLEHVHSLTGVSVAAMDLAPGGGSPLIVSGSAFDADAVRDVVEHLGFHVPSPSGRDLPDGAGSSPRATSSLGRKHRPVSSSMEGRRS